VEPQRPKAALFLGYWKKLLIKIVLLRTFSPFGDINKIQQAQDIRHRQEVAGKEAIGNSLLCVTAITVVCSSESYWAEC